MRKAFIEALHELAARDPRVCLVTGDLGFLVVEKFAATYPDRFINVGVAEQNMVGIATGMAQDGWIPFCYSIATFASMRPYEQLRNGPVLHSLPVRVVGIGGGFAYGHAGITHFALEDLAIMRAQPGLAVVAPADPAQTRAALLATWDLPGPVYYRVGKGGNAPLPGLDGRFGLGSVELVGSGPDLLLLSTGSIAVAVETARRQLEAEGVRATLAVVAALSPPPTDLAALLARFPAAVSVEEHYVRGGLGSLVAEAIATSGARTRLSIMGARELTLGPGGSESFLRARAGLSIEAIVAESKAVLARSRA